MKAILLESIALLVTLVVIEPSILVAVVPVIKPTILPGISAAMVGAAMTAIALPNTDEIMIDVQFRLFSIAFDYPSVAATSWDTFESMCIQSQI